MKLEDAEKENIDDSILTGFAKKKAIEEEHYLQFNLTYDDFALQFVPIMLEIMDHLMMPANGIGKEKESHVVRICYIVLAHTRGSENSLYVDVNT